MATDESEFTVSSPTPSSKKSASPSSTILSNGNSKIVDNGAKGDNEEEHDVVGYGEKNQKDPMMTVAGTSTTTDRIMSTDKQEVIVPEEHNNSSLVPVADQQLMEQQVNGGEQEEEDGDEEPEEYDKFIRITAAHHTLQEAQVLDGKKDYASALQLYRVCIDLLLEELIHTDGTEQSKKYLREKCEAIMDRADVLKGLLPPIPLTENEAASPALEQQMQTFAITD